MFSGFAVFFDNNLLDGLAIGGIVLGGLIALIFFFAFFSFGSLWLAAKMSSADVSLASMIGMSFRQVSPSLIVNAKIMATQAGINVKRLGGINTNHLEAHFLAGGDVMNVVRAIIAANRAGIDLDFDRAAAIDLAGRDVLDAVRTSVSPKVIDCPDSRAAGKRTSLSAVARNGVELLINVRVTVRTNLDQLIGGATEDTIIARVGQGIITAIGSADSHMDVLELPDRISKGVLARGLDTNTAFAIVSIDIANITVGKNIGARLQTDQAEADTRTARAHAEIRRAEALAFQQEMTAELFKNRSLVLDAEAKIPGGMIKALSEGRVKSKYKWGSQDSTNNVTNNAGKP